MRIKLSDRFYNKFLNQVDYIAEDKPSAARKFKNLVLQEITKIAEMPYKNRQSIFFEQEQIRDLVMLGYIITYEINEQEDSIIVFGFSKWENSFK